MATSGRTFLLMLPLYLFQ